MPSQYQVISIIGRTLEEFDDDKRIPCFGFGLSAPNSYSPSPHSLYFHIHLKETSRRRIGVHFPSSTIVFATQSRRCCSAMTRSRPTSSSPARPTSLPSFTKPYPSSSPLKRCEAPTFRWIFLIGAQDHLHILVIIADGQVTDEVDTVDAIGALPHNPLFVH